MTKVFVVTVQRDTGKWNIDAVYSTEEAALAAVRDFNSGDCTWVWKEYFENTLDEPGTDW